MCDSVDNIRNFSRNLLFRLTKKPPGPCGSGGSDIIRRQSYFVADWSASIGQ